MFKSSELGCLQKLPSPLARKLYGSLVGAVIYGLVTSSMLKPLILELSSMSVKIGSYFLLATGNRSW